MNIAHSALIAALVAGCATATPRPSPYQLAVADYDELRLRARPPAPAPAPTPAAAVEAPAPVQTTAEMPKADAEHALSDAMSQMAKARAGLHGHELSKQDVEAAMDARDALGKALEDAGDTDAAKSAAELIAAVDDDIRLADLIAQFVAGPGAAHKKGYAFKQRRALREALGAFQSCVQGSRRMISESPVLNRTALFLSESRTSPKKIQAACAKEQKVLSRQIARR